MLGLGSSFQRRELIALGLLAAQTFFLALSDAAIYIVGYSLFIDRFGAGEVPYLYIILGLLAALFFSGLALLQRKVPVGFLALGTYCAVALFLLVNWAAFRFQIAVDLSIYALAAFFPMFLTVLLVATGGQAGFLFDVRQMKRVFPLIMTMELVGFVVGSLSSPYLIPLLDELSTLLLIGTATALVGAGFALLTLQRFPVELRRLPRAGPVTERTSIRAALAGRLSTTLFGYQLLSAVGTQLVIYIFLTQADLQFTTPAALASFFAAFAGWRNIVSLLFMTFVAGTLLSRYGLRLGLLLNPAVVALLVVAMLLSRRATPEALTLFFWLTVLTYVMDNLLTDGITSTSIKTAYQVLPDAHRTTIETVVEGIGVPFAFVLTGLILLLFSAFPTLTITHVLLFTLLVTFLWSAAALGAVRGYTRALIVRLRRRLVEEEALTLDDASSLAVVLDMLDDGSPRLVRIALDLLEREGHPSLDGRLAALLDRPDPEIQIEALARIGRRGRGAGAPVVARLVADEVAAPVAAAALRALSALDRPAALTLARPLLDSPRAALGQAALVTLLDENEPAARGRLQQLAADPEPETRVRAADAIRESGAERGLLASLLADPAADVRRAALRATADLGSAALWPQVLARLDEPACQSEALDALLAGGRDTVPLIAGALDEPARPLQSRERLLRVLGLIGGEEAIQLLKCYLDDPQPSLSLQAVEALGSAGARMGAPELWRWMEPLIERGVRVLRAQAAMGEGPATPTIRQALHMRERQIQRSIFLLLALHYDPLAMQRAAEHVVRGSSRQRALALETLDVHLPRQPRSVIVPLVDPSLPIEEKIRLLEAYSPAPDQGRDAWLEEIILQPTLWPEAWMRACAIYDAARLELPALDQWLESLPPDPPDLVAEVVRWAAAPTAPDATRAQLTIEKVAILQQIPIFAEVVPDSLLAAVARIIETVQLPPNETFITEGGIEDCMYVVLDGEVRVHSQGRTIITLGQGKSVGELAVLDPEPRSASVTTVGACRLFRIDRASFDQVMADRPGIARGVIRALCDRIRAQGRLMAGREETPQPRVDATHRVTVRNPGEE